MIGASVASLYFFHRLVEAVLLRHTTWPLGIQYLIVFLPEIIVWGVILLALWRLASDQVKLNKNGWWLMGVLAALAGVILFGALRNHYTIGQLIIGLRYSYLWPFALGAAAVWGEKIKPSGRFLQVGALVLLALALIELLAGPGYLSRIGLIWPGTEFGYGEAHWLGPVPQLSLFLGSNQLAQLAGVMAVLVAMMKNWRPRLYVLAGLGAVVALTLSRSGLLATLLTFSLMLIMPKIRANWRGTLKALGMFLLGALLAFGFIMLRYHPSAYELVWHGESTRLHQESLAQVPARSGLDFWFGLGVGQSTPAPFHRYLPESAFTAMSYDLGAVWILLWILLFWAIGKSDPQNNQTQPWACSLLVLILAGIFLQPFADNPAAVYLVAFGLGGGLKIAAGRKP